MSRLRRYFTTQAPRNPLQQAMRLWAAQHLDGLMSAGEQQAAIQVLLDRQRPDGGWSLAEFHHGWAGVPSDGGGTAFILYVLRQAGVPAKRPALVRGVHWLQSNQRASGGWFTPTEGAGVPSEFAPESHGTRELGMFSMTASFAVMALRACEESEAVQAPWQRLRFERSPGLAMRHRLLDW